jgi:hypothetical protein
MIKLHFNVLGLLVLVSMSTSLHAVAGKAVDSLYHDYVVTAGGDTVKGKVLKLRTAAVKIDPLSTAQPVLYKFEQVKEICRDGVTYDPVISLTGAHKHVFAQRVLHGRIDLFVHVIPVKNGEMVAYYAGKAGNAPVEVESSNVWPNGFASKSVRRNNLLSLISDDEESARELAAKKNYNSDDLVGLIARYNSHAR